MHYLVGFGSHMSREVCEVTRDRRTGPCVRNAAREKHVLQAVGRCRLNAQAHQIYIVRTGNRIRSQACKQVLNVPCPLSEAVDSTRSVLW